MLKIWPPISIKDTGSRLHSKLKEAIIQSGLEKNVFGNHLVSLPAAESRVPPPAFASDPLMHVSGVEDRDKSSENSFTKEAKYSDEVGSAAGTGSTKLSESEIVEIDGSSLGNQFKPDQEPNFIKSVSPKGPGATTRKGAYYVERQNSEISYYADDEDGTHKKYTRRGPFRHKFLRMLLPFWSNALPTLPVTAPPRKDLANTNDVPEGRLRHQRSSKIDPRKILLVMAIM
ncbi:putative zinc finger protein-like 1 [Cocos nucifera]|uniref:Putative zinc finger protein-like 1 n=1 Tax=Cocos nucifera TaxID=13894 RepID=A0A8K0I7Y4_COCNU|nr:putative zinc finger protein-like 1 [Cocos nucifera]